MRLDCVHCNKLRLQKYTHAFTLIELLVVVAIIALLIGILLPSLARARDGAKETVCVTQIRQLMAAALMYTTDNRESLPGCSANAPGSKDASLSWSGVYQVMVNFNNRDASPAWTNAPKGGTLWKYYQDPAILECPSAEKFNGKFSYSTPENVALAVEHKRTINSSGYPTGPRFQGVPPKMGRVKYTTDSIQFLDEDEKNGISGYSVDDAFGAGDMFADRHLGKASVAFFDGHAAAYYFPRGDRTAGPNAGGTQYHPDGVDIRYKQNESEHPFEAWMMQIAPFNSKHTPKPWKWSGKYEDWPKFKGNTNWWDCSQIPDEVGCE